MRDLPSGTVTLLFTDVEGSTRLLDELGAERYAEALADHRRRLRETFARHGGVEVDTQGDAFFYAFARASDAIGAAEEGQSVLADGSIRVRVGVHTGEPLVTNEGYVGTDVHRAARIAAAGHGGQVLVSEQTARLLKAAPLRYLGEHRLKDVDEALRLFQLGAGDFPPPRTLTASVVPLPATPLVGRKREFAEVLRLLSRERARLVTLTGPGGVGKTRLALELAAELVAEMADGVFVVDLSALREPALVLPAIASTLGAKDEVRDHIADKELLLVLDNVEHVAGAARDLAALLAACGRLQMLATSREPLHVATERGYPLRPLPEAPAVELFRQRAEAVEPDFEAPPDVLAEVCRRLDNLPLAIELAAARVKVLDASELLARLERRLPLLTSRGRDLAERQRTLRATIEWSHELLDDVEQQLFRRLSVFAGGFELRAAEEVASADLDTLESLVDKSLVRHEDGRYSMLETIREYAGERLEQSGEAEDLSRAHAEYFHRTATAASEDVVRLDEPGRRTMQLFGNEIGNYRAALSWLLARGDFETAAGAASPLGLYWFRSAQPREAVVWLERLLENEGALAPATRARVRWQKARMLEFAGERGRADELYEQVLHDARARGDQRSLREALFALGGSAARRGDIETARVLLDESVSLARRSAEDRQGFTLALGTRGAFAHDEGDREGAERYLQEALAVAREHRTISLPPLLQRIADFALEDGDVVRAASLYRESLALCVEGRMAEWIPSGLGGIAATAAERGDLRAAGRLWGAVETLEQQRGRLVSRVREIFGARIRASAATDPAVFDAGLEAGRRLPTDEAIAEALDEDFGSRPSSEA